ncbi:MAG TPA: hypothetical protein VNP90_05215, partial [Actinomycetota bacterium]|nr:hypothetical protein [Actinomycetota bacterium]
MTRPSTPTILLGLAVGATILVVFVVVIGWDPTAWFRGLSLDFPYYVWRTKAVSAGGLDALAVDLPGLNLERPAFPVLASLLGSALRVDTVTLVRAIQVAVTTAVGLAAGSFALAVLGEHRWAFPVFALTTAASSEVAWTSVRSLDNLLVDAVVLAIAVAAITSATGTRGRAAAIGGFAAVALIHWVFGGLFLLLLAGVTLVIVPWSFLEWRRGTRFLQTPATRLGVTVAGAAVAGWLSLLAVAPSSPAELPPTQGDRGNLRRLPTLHLPIRGPLAALGAIALWIPADTRRRIGAIMLVLWSLSVPAAMLISEYVDRPVKVFRVAGFALGIPILGAAALVAVVRLTRRYGTVGRVAGGLALAAGVALVVVSSIDVYRMPTMEGASGARLDQVRATQPYLETVPAGRPVVFLVSRRNPFILDRLVRAGLPAERIAQARMYWGGIDDLLAGRAGAQDEDLRSARAGRAWWHRWWRDWDAVLAADPVIFYVKTLNPLLDPPDGAEELAPGVLLVSGPPPPTDLERVPRLGTSWPTIIGSSFGVLVLLG